MRTNKPHKHAECIKAWADVLRLSFDMKNFLHGKQQIVLRGIYIFNTALNHNQ